MWSNNSVQKQRTRESKKRWEIITSLAVLISVAGFITQFIGLRGLAYPCAIAQLLAICSMAFIRAWIRRRIGRVRAHSLALPGYELDFLALHIVFSPEFRLFDPGSPEPMTHHTIPPWRVSTPRLTQHDDQTTPTKHSCEDSHKIAQSSGDLVKIRKRLGDLCQWKSKSTESAVALARSIELFMDTFFPKAKGSRTKLVWNIATFKSRHDCDSNKDTISIPVERGSTDKPWKVDLGILDAVLSLWMSNIQTQADTKNKQASKKSWNTGAAAGSPQSQDWRETKAGIESKYQFCRILGNDSEDGLLKRDIAWWVDELLADQSDNYTQQGDVDITIGFDGTHSEFFDFSSYL